jgi:cobalamin transport system ATP-binding protein
VSSANRVLLEGKAISAGYGKDPLVLIDVDVQVRRGEIICLVGPNGAGKSTLLSVLAGLQSPLSGEVLIGDSPMSELSGRARARRIGYLPQDVYPSVSYTVSEMVALGRFPHARGLGFENGRDVAAVDKAMQLTRVDVLKNRPFDEISGGERQRVLIASVLAQEPEVLLLDEPTAALDIGQRAAVFSTLRELAAKGVAVAVVTHDLNLAGLFADHILLLAKNKVAAVGNPVEVINEENLKTAYGDGFVLVQRPDQAVQAVLPALPGVSDE